MFFDNSTGNGTSAGFDESLVEETLAICVLALCCVSCFGYGIYRYFCKKEKPRKIKFHRFGLGDVVADREIEISPSPMPLQFSNFTTS